MSRNNLIMVAEDRRARKIWYYVLFVECADDDLEACARRHIRRKPKRTRRFATALVLAHAMDRQLETEYGVRVVPLKGVLEDHPND